MKNETVLVVLGFFKWTNWRAKCTQALMPIFVDRYISERQDILHFSSIKRISKLLLLDTETAIWYFYFSIDLYFSPFIEVGFSFFPFLNFQYTIFIFNAMFFPDGCPQTNASVRSLERKVQNNLKTCMGDGVECNHTLIGHLLIFVYL